MKGFYEQHREKADRLCVFKHCTHLFPAHYHQNLEVFLLKKGKYSLTRNGEKIQLTGGSVCVFDCYDVHSYDENTDDGDGIVIMIPPKYLSFWMKKRSGRKILTPVVSDVEFLERLEKTSTLFLSENEEILSSSARLFLAFLDERLSFATREQASDDHVFKKLLVYAQENFRENVTLASAAKALGYTKPYLSRIFHRYAQTGFPSYVNALRLEYVSRERKNSDKKLSELIFEAGFQSLQTYYRQLKTHN